MNVNQLKKTSSIDKTSKQPNYKMALLYASPIVAETDQYDQNKQKVLTDKDWTEIDFNAEFKWRKMDHLDRIVQCKQILATTKNFTEVLNKRISVLHFSGHGNSQPIDLNPKMNHKRADSLIFEKEYGIADVVDKKWIED